MYIVLSVLLGVLIGALLPWSIPAQYSIYAAVMLLAALDAAAGGINARLHHKFRGSLFVSGALGNGLIAVFLRTFAADLRIGACPLTMSQLFADLDLICGAGTGQDLLVRVHRNKFHTLRSSLHHAVDHVVAAAADANDLNIDYVFRTDIQTKCHMYPPSASAANCPIPC